jgi:hypothetical protein
MKKVAICMFHPWYVSSWFDTNIINELASKIELTLLVTKEVLDVCIQRDLQKDYRFKFEEISPNQPSFASRVYFFTSMIVRRKTNKSFNFRLKRLIFGELRFLPIPFTFRTFFICLKANFSSLKNYTRSYFYQLPLFIPIIDSFILKLFKFIFENKKFSIPVRLYDDFDLVIFVSAAEEIEIFEMLKELKDIGTKTLLCIENWDNLTSKRFMISKPDYTFVLGNDSKELAARYQNLDIKSVIAAGLPRFNPLRSYVPKFNQIDLKKFQILYIGFYLPHNEVQLLNKLIGELDKTDICDFYEITYKPHPGPRIRLLDDASLNSKIRVISSEERKNPKLDATHLSRILNSNLIIAAPTSMVIECMVLGKKLVLDLTDDGVNRTTAKQAFNKYIHFDILNSIENLNKCYSLDEMVSIILKEFESPNTNFIEYPIYELLENKKSSYSEHIINLL